MSEYKLLCYKDKFEHYKAISNDIIRAIPASNHDEFALIACVNANGRIGFDSDEKAGVLLGAITTGCYSLAGKKLVYIPSIVAGQSRTYAFKPKDKSFQGLITEHEKYELEVKIHKFMQRHGRPCSLPQPATLTSFLTEERHPIDVELYRKIIESCHYVIQKVGSGEHGFGAFEVPTI